MLNDWLVKASSKELLTHQFADTLFPPAVMLDYKLREVMSTSCEKIKHSGGHAISGNSSKYDNQTADKSVGPNVSNCVSSSLGSLAPKTLAEQGIMLMESQSIKAGPQVLLVVKNL